ncbi:MAG TPA: DUF1254 domain-containing protein [Acetobacteraceae bacterium]|jgi:hypothetical protein|nr:DUF1254 domain-containing protein [Acetobacteraceae bacterium]
MRDQAAMMKRTIAMQHCARGLLRWVARAMLVATVLTMPMMAAADPKPTEEQAHAIAVDAYVYLYPLITMDITRKQLTNTTEGFGRGPMNAFSNVPAYPPASDKTVVRTNYDTLYSIAYLDMLKEPVVVSVPDTAGRYYLLPMLDMWTDVFASPGWRTTGTQAANFLVTPPGWSGTVPADMIRIAAPTPYVWIIGRTKTDGPSDYEAVRKIQAGYKITLLSEWGKTPTPPTLKVDPSVDMKTPPRQQVDTMPAGKFFAYAAELMGQQPPHVTDQPILAQMKKLGIEPGKPFDIANVDPIVAKALETAPEDGQALMDWKVPTVARIANGWSMNTDTMGVYGNYYLKRAIIARLGLGANLPEDAIYPLNLADEDGKPLDGANRYTIHFDKATAPPVNAFWSITMYDPDGFAYPNNLNRQAVSSWMPFKYNADGSLDLYFQNESPGPSKEANWLPSPKGGFNVTMRLYGPKPDALTGRWNPPPIVKTPGANALSAQ